MSSAVGLTLLVGLLLMTSCKWRSFRQTGSWSAPWRHDWSPWQQFGSKRTPPVRMCRRCGRRETDDGDWMV